MNAAAAYPYPRKALGFGWVFRAAVASMLLAWAAGLPTHAAPLWSSLGAANQSRGLSPTAPTSTLGELSEHAGGRARPAVVSGQLLVRFRPGTARFRQEALLAQLPGKVKFFAHPAASRTRAQLLGSTVFEQLALLQVDSPSKVGAVLAQLLSQPEVLYTEPNYRLQIVEQSSGPVIPNDFDFDQLWGLDNSGQTGGTPGIDIHAAEAWRWTRGDPNVVVAILDTGIDYYHPDLAQNIWSNPKEIPGNGLDDDANGFVDDVHGYDFVNGDSDPMDDMGHGTHVAGILGAVGNNQIGVVGVCWRVSLMAVKVFDANGNGQVDTAIEGIRYAIDNGARIINASWGGYDKSQALEDVLAEAHRAGVLVVAAAGNDSSQNPFYPAACNSVIGVGALNAQGQRSRFSNYGPYVQVAAPGEEIRSTFPNHSYATYSGTSMAAPCVSGVAALVLAEHPDFTHDQLANVLLNSVKPISTDGSLGTGLINAAAAVQVAVPLPQVQLNLPSTLFGNVDIAGTAVGARFAGYSLEYGSGPNPTNWTALSISSTPVTNGVLAFNFSTPDLREGLYTFRLTARNSSGEQAVQRVPVQISNVHLTFPMSEDVLRAGDKISLIGTVFGGNRTFRVQYGTGPSPATWSEAGIQLANGGQAGVQEDVLATWDTAAVAPDQFYTLKLTATAADGSVDAFTTYLVYLDSHLKPGWPRYVPAAGDFPVDDWRQVTVADLDNDGSSEIILVDHGSTDGRPARLLVFRSDGSLLWSKVLASGYPYSDIPVVGDVDGDGFKEIFVDVGSTQQLFAFRYDGSPLPGKWPVHLEATSLGKVLADLDGDGKKELIGYSNDTISHDGKDYRQLVVYDHLGNLLRKWEVPACSTDLDLPRIFPAVANLDSDPDLEIVGVSGCDTVAAFKLSNESGPLWTTRTAGSFVASPVIGDLSHSGTNDIVLGALDLRGGKRGGLYAFDNRGRLLPGWPVLMQESFSAAPALGDLFGDGQLEISLPGSKSQLLHLVRADGFEPSGWPVGPIMNSSLRTSSVLGDIDGDGLPDVVLPSPGYPSQIINLGDMSQAGGIKAWNRAGQPINLGANRDSPALVIESSSGDYCKAAPAVLADLDHSGKLDIVASSIRDRTYLPIGQKAAWKFRSSIYVWELDTPFTPAQLPWPTFQANAAHTGSLPIPTHIPQPPAVSGIPNQVIPAQGSFFPIPLDQYVADADNSPDQISWVVRGNKNLKVLLSADRVVTIQPPSPTWVGAESLTFVATDPSGLQSSASAIFEVRLDYTPPIANSDHTTTLENAPIEIGVLANDSAPNGTPLQVTGFSRPAHGKVTNTTQGTLVYSPNLYFHGSDTFTYTISDAQGGVALGAVTIDVLPVNQPPTSNPVHVIIDQDSAVTLDIISKNSDPDGDPVALRSFTQPSHGTLTANPDTTLRYLPALHYVGLDSFSYVLADPAGATNHGTVSIMVKPVYRPPVVLSQSIILNRNSSANINFAASDSDPSETKFTFTIVDAPRNGALWLYPNSATYYPPHGFSGADHFTYKANDGFSDSLPASIHLKVLPVNNPPVAQDQSCLIKINRLLKIALHATDLDDDPLTYRIVAPSAYGDLVGSNASYTYTPKHGFLGTDTFSFQASDGQSLSRVATVTVNVTDKNTSPVAQDSTVQAIPNTPVDITLLASDLESDPLTFRVTSPPLHGKLSGIGPVLRYTPAANFKGPDRFSFKANDGEADSNPATVTLAVESLNHPPVATNQLLAVSEGSTAHFRLAVTDPDGDVLNCPILDGPRHGLLYGLGTQFTYKPATNFAGSDSFTYQAWDGHVYSQRATVSITVRPVEPSGPPVFESISVLPGGQSRLLLNNRGSKPALVQFSTNLFDWLPLPGCFTQGQTNTILDLDAPSFPWRFYRARHD